MPGNLKILITGATGAVGRDLIPFLKNEFQECQILAIIRNNDKFNSIFGDTIPTVFIDDKNTIIDFNPNIVIHLASFVTSKNDIESAKSLVESNIWFGIQLLDIIKDCPNLELFLNFGTFAEYKDGIDSFNSAYLYSASKTAFRSFADFYSNSYGFNLVHIVPYTIYGGTDSQKKLFDYIYESFFSDSVVKMTPGEQILDFIHMQDVCKAICSILKYNNYQSLNKKSFFLGTGIGTKIKELAKIFERKLDKRPNIEWGGLEYRMNDIMYAVANTLPLKGIGFLPSIFLEQGVDLYIIYQSYYYGE